GWCWWSRCRRRSRGCRGRGSLFGLSPIARLRKRDSVHLGFQDPDHHTSVLGQGLLVPAAVFRAFCHFGVGVRVTNGGEELGVEPFVQEHANHSRSAIARKLPVGWKASTRDRAAVGVSFDHDLVLFLFRSFSRGQALDEFV